jgi:sigma-B regulation protein RsbU (phosphoserine phosphatase)
MMLGVDRGPKFDRALRQEVVTLEPGDVFLQYTDGVTEAMNPSNEEFGMVRLTDSVARAAGGSAEVITGEVTSALDRFMGPRAQEDDITLIVLRRLPAEDRAADAEGLAEVIPI